MQRQLSLLDPTPAPDVGPVWEGLDERRRAEVVAMLAGLIAKAINRKHEGAATSSEEKDDE